MPRRPSVRSSDRRGQDGQALVLFAISLVAILAMAGLVLDGGSAFAQRRDEQNAADLAAMAGGTAYLNTLAAGGSQSSAAAAADAAARQVATANGYTDDELAEVSVDVTVASAALTGRTTVQVTITKPHPNNFAGVVGQPSWDVGADATVLTGVPNAAVGAMPVIFNELALDPLYDPGTPKFYNEPGTGNEDVPQDQTQFNWTVYCTASGNPCNANSNTVRDLIEGHGESTTIDLDDQIGPLNAGSHTTLFDSLEQWIGHSFPVAIVDDAGAMVGWSMFTLTDVQGSSEKVIEGYFEGAMNAPPLDIVECEEPDPDDCPPVGQSFGSYVLKLID